MLEIGSGPWVQTGGKHSFLNHPVDKTKQGQWVLSGFCLSKASFMFWITAAEDFCCPFHARPNHSSFPRSHYKKVEFPHAGLIACATHCISLTSLNNWCYESTKQSSCRKSLAQNSCSPEGLINFSRKYCLKPLIKVWGSKEDLHRSGWATACLVLFVLKSQEGSQEAKYGSDLKGKTCSIIKELVNKGGLNVQQVTGDPLTTRF